MAWPAGRLPIALAPLPGEALESYLGAYARRLHTSTDVLLEHAGLSRAVPGQMALRLTEAEAAALEAATGVDELRLRAMTLEPYDGLAVTIRNGRRRLGRAPAWRFSGSRSRFCPGCLADAGGRGPVTWRLPWAFACLIHQVLLVDQCPACHRPPRPFRARRLGPQDPGCCTRASPASTDGHHGTCAADLTQAPAIVLPAGGLILAAQAHLAGLLGDGGNRPRPDTVDKLRQLYALASPALLGLHSVRDTAPPLVQEVLGECGGTVPGKLKQDVGGDAHNVAVGTALARIALTGEHPQAEALFDWILRADRARQPGAPAAIGIQARRWRWAGPELTSRVLARLDPHASLHARMRYASATPRPRWPELDQGAIRRRARTIPAMLWPGWSMRLLPLPSDPVDQRPANQRIEMFRRGCASFLLLPGGPPDLNFERVGPLLGNYRIDAGRDGVERRLYQGRDLTPLACALAQLAFALDEHASPIDYNRRREAFTGPDAIRIDQRAYTRLCLQHGWAEAGRKRLDAMTWYTLLLLTGEHHRAPTGASSRRYASNCTRFRYGAPAALKAFLADQARALLEQRGIEEPVTWEPPRHWVADITFPGVEPGDMSADRFEQITPRSPSVHHAAAELAITAEHLRLYCDTAGAGGRYPSVNGIAPAADRVRLLAPDTLRDLHVNRDTAVETIARMAGSSPETVTRLLRHDHTPVHNHRRPRPLTNGELRDLLERDYVQRRRDPAAIARELGVSHKYIHQKLLAFALPVRAWRDFDGLADLNLPAPPSPAIQAVTTGPGALERLHMITALPGYHSIAAAANDLYHCSARALYMRIARIERLAGTRLIDARARDLKPTEQGRAFIAEAQRILQIAKETEARSATTELVAEPTAVMTPDSESTVHPNTETPDHLQ